MCPAPEVNEGIAVERANGTSEIVLTSPALSIIVAASAVTTAHLHMDDPRLLDCAGARGAPIILGFTAYCGWS